MGGRETGAQNDLPTQNYLLRQRKLRTPKKVGSLIRHLDRGVREKKGVRRGADLTPPPPRGGGRKQFVLAAGLVQEAGVRKEKRRSGRGDVSGRQMR